MSYKTVSITGHAYNNEQFVVKAGNFDIRFNQNSNEPKLNAPSPIEYILAGYAGCIHAVGTLVAKELNLDLISLQVDIYGQINVDKYLGNSTADRAGFKSIDVALKPIVVATTNELQKWLEIVESRCPVYDNLANATPITVNLVEQPAEVLP